MTPQQQMVQDFHEKFEVEINTKPTYFAPQHPTRVLRSKLIREELKEYDDAINEVEIAGALGDLLYVVLGAAVSHGIDLEQVFSEIHRSNMTKVWPDGKIYKNEFGKVIKPESYSPADIKMVLDKQV
jgi:predicted HAD superfamily Cof-like phosphohydrolase